MSTVYARVRRVKVLALARAPHGNTSHAPGTEVRIFVPQATTLNLGSDQLVAVKRRERDFINTKARLGR